MTVADREAERVPAFADFRKAHVERCKLWHVGFHHDSLWDARHWLNALLGDVTNVVTKRHRNEIMAPGALDAAYEALLDGLADEFADVICYGDLCCAKRGWEWHPGRGVEVFAPSEHDDATASSLEVGMGIGSTIPAPDDLQDRRDMDAVVAECQQLAGFFAIDLAGTAARRLNSMSERQGCPKRLATVRSYA